MRLTSRDEGGGRGGGGKEEEGGVDELHFYLGLGMSWTINCLDCDRIGGRVARKKNSEEQKSYVISLCSWKTSAWRVAESAAAGSCCWQERDTTAQHGEWMKISLEQTRSVETVRKPPNIS